MSLSPGTRVGPYEVISLLGAGGMGEVYRARDQKLNRDVAIKVLADVVAADPDRLARSRREAQVLASLNHPNIAQIYGVEDASSIHGLVMELVDGPTLADRVAQGPLPLDEALSIGRQITDALEAAHEQGIIHRDLKPANIKVRNDGTVKVLDFGLAKLADPTTASDVNVTASPTLSRHATMAGVILGTAAYMSPEQARGKAVDKRADIWAFGCVLYEMVTGRRAFAGDDVTETFAAIVRDQPDLSQVPAQLRRLLARCFEKDPRRRLRDIGDVWTLVDDDGQQPSVRLKPDPTTNAPAWRRAFPWAVAAAAAIAAIGVAVVHLTETRFVPRPVRFQLQVPDEAGSTTPVISPDGTRVAYRFGGQIWVRDLGSVESRPIAPTDRAVGRFFWSADSRFVMYGATGKLLRVPAAGGSPETLGDQPLPVSGGFGLPDGGVVVSPAAALPGASETRRIDKNGTHALTGISLDMRGGASLLPDGKRFLYAMLQPEASRGVYVASIDNAAAPERILSDASDVAYVSSARGGDEGYLLLQRQDTLVALPVDAARLRPRGEPIVLAKGVGGFTASAGDSLVYRTAAGRRLTWYDRQGMATGTAWSPGPFNELALSADGTRVVVVRADGPTTWVHEFARESSARVAPALRAAIKPVWSPKGDRILVVSTRSGQTDFFSVATDGGGADKLLFSSAVAWPTSWSRDGRWLMYTSVNPRTREDLWIVSADGTGKPEPFLVTDNKETDGTFSPDGRAVAYVSDESGTSNVYVRSFPSTGAHKWQVSTAGGYQPRWRGDGKELFYISPTGQLLSVDITPGIATAPGRPTLLFQTAIFGGGASVNNWYWDVTADGQRFLINSVIGGAEPSTLNVVLNWQSGLSR